MYVYVYTRCYKNFELKEEGEIAVKVRKQVTASYHPPASIGYCYVPGPYVA